MLGLWSRPRAAVVFAVWMASFTGLAPCHGRQLRLFGERSGLAASGAGQAAKTSPEEGAVAERPPPLARAGDAEEVSRPRMVVMDGCSGSSYIVAQTKYLFNLHGHQTSFNHQPELFVPWQNSFFRGERRLGEAVELVNKEEVSHNKTLVFKGSSENLHIEEGKMAWTTSVAPSLRRMQTYAVYAFRSNVLDHAVCMVKDCFSLEYGVRNFSKDALGHPVAANGTRRSECFMRRKTNVPSKDYKVLLHPEVLTQYLRASYQNVAAERAKLRSTVTSDFNIVTAEDLTAFEHDRSKFDVSARSWHALLRSLGIKPDNAIIKSYLAKSAGTRAPPAPHNETIYNFDEVRASLEAAGTSFARLVRT